MDPEELILALIALFGALGLIGFLGSYIPIINVVPFIFSLPHQAFLFIAGFIDPLFTIGVTWWAVILELLVAIIFAFISYKVGF